MLNTAQQRYLVVTGGAGTLRRRVDAMHQLIIIIIIVEFHRAHDERVIIVIIIIIMKLFLVCEVHSGLDLVLLGELDNLDDIAELGVTIRQRRTVSEATDRRRHRPGLGPRLARSLAQRRVVQRLLEDRVCGHAAAGR